MPGVEARGAEPQVPDAQTMYRIERGGGETWFEAQLMYFEDKIGLGVPVGDEWLFLPMKVVGEKGKEAVIFIFDPKNDKRAKRGGAKALASIIRTEGIDLQDVFAAGSDKAIPMTEEMMDLLGMKRRHLHVLRREISETEPKKKRGERVIPYRSVTSDKQKWLFSTLSQRRIAERGGIAYVDDVISTGETANASFNVLGLGEEVDDQPLIFVVAQELPLENAEIVQGRIKGIFAPSTRQNVRSAILIPEIRGEAAKWLIAEQRRHEKSFRQARESMKSLPRGWNNPNLTY